MALPKPSTHIDWTDGSLTKVTEPSAGKKLQGYIASERPPATEHNWLWYMLDQWAKYFESVTDELTATLAVFDAVVGSGPLATHATIQAAHDDVLTVPGSTILVIEDQVLASTVNITKAEIEIQFKPNVTVSNGGATPSGFNIGSSADGFRMRFGRFTGWNGGGESAIEVAADADFVMIRDTRFFDNTTDIEDNSNPTISVSGTITE